MKKEIAYLLVFASLITAGWSSEVGGPPQLTEIECSIKPINRSKIHCEATLAHSNNAITGATTSNNWGGYVAAPTFKTSDQGSVTYVAGSWIVPTLLPTPDNSFTSIWVGIDGFLDHTVEQIGTAHNWENGSQNNYAWFEMYPNGAFEISGFPADPGDMIGAKVAYKGDDTFKLVLNNHTKGVTTTVPMSYTKAVVERSSAEWVVEAPFSNAILPLSNFQMATLNYCAATINGTMGTINNNLWINESVTMGNSTVLKAVPSVLLKNGSCFQVTWKHE